MQKLREETARAFQKKFSPQHCIFVISQMGDCTARGFAAAVCSNCAEFALETFIKENIVDLLKNIYLKVFAAVQAAAAAAAPCFHK